VNAQFQNLHPIQRFAVRVVNGSQARTVTIPSDPETAADLITVLPRMVFVLILLAAGIALVMLRPSKATWGFFIFVALNAGAPVNAIIWLGPPAYQIAMGTWATIGWSLFSQLGAFIFALYLLVTPPIARWRRIAEITAYAITVATTGLSAWSVLSWTYRGVPLAAVNRITLGLEILAALAPPLLLAVTYASSSAATRERIRWVIFAFIVNAFVFMVVFVTGQGITNLTIPYWLWSALAGIDTVILATTVLYAVLKHHILDINVAISRALVYTILSAIIVGAFALVDVFFNRTVSARSAGLIADIALALVLGFFFNSLHYRIDRFVDAVLFRQRHAAEEHLRTVIRGMPFTVSETQVDRLVVEEPLRSFFLTSAALFGCTDTGQFELRHAIGTSLAGLVIASREDALPVYLQGERCALRLNKHGWDVAGIAIPIFSHGDLTAIAVYGLHQNGTDLDSEEIEMFEHIGAAAGNAYDRLEAQRLREEVRELRLQRV
jgi:hypothetical protein